MTALFKDQSGAQMKNILVFSFVLLFILDFDLFPFGCRLCFCVE